MKFKVKKIDISAGDYLVCLIHSKDAKALDISNSDRVCISSKSRSIPALVDISNTDHFLQPGEIGLMNEIYDKLKVKKGDFVKLFLMDKPLSLHYIKQKLDGKTLTDTEIYDIVSDIVKGKLSDIEIAYFVAGCYMHKMTTKETVALTNAMINTGEILNFDKYPIVDKHCIGGVAGNRTTMLVVPVITSLGYKMPKTSSRSITSPAGTADTMEVLCPVSLSSKQILNVVDKINGCMVWGGALNLAPADDKIIKAEHPVSLDPISQLLASIMAKKKSVSATHLLIDIPYGKGSKVSELKRAKYLGRQFLSISKHLNIKTKVVYSEGSQPIGNGIGPALEARDVLWVLENDKRAPHDLKEKAIRMSGEIIEFISKSKKGEKIAREVVESGQALDQMRNIIKAQKGKILSSEKVPLGKFKFYIKSQKHGIVSNLANKKIAKIAKICGAPMDKGAGLYLHYKRHDKVETGNTIMTLYSNNKQKLKYAKEVYDKIGGFDIV